MSYRELMRIVFAPLLPALLAVFAGAPLHAQPLQSQSVQPPASAQHTRNVVLIVSDGLRLRKEFWREDASERRRALLPFLWSTVAVHGQIFGNQAVGSVARITNGLAFSYPGYNEMLTGHPDPRIDSNEFGPNPNVSVLEWLNTLPDLHGKVSVYATWATFKDIFNVARSHLPLRVGWDPPYHGSLSPQRALLNRLYQTTTRLDEEDVYDSFLQVPLLESFTTQHPRVLFVGYGETDDWAHAGRYDLVLHAAHHFDQFVSELWERLQGLPAYRDSTTFIITTDHGRGSGPTEWKEHGVEQKGSENIWIAVLGPDTLPLGERRQTAEVHQAQIAATVAALLGKDYRKAVPAAAAPISEVLGRSR
jgi:Type I phosphodiesterase / nucleotide pyrophosphatase